MNHNGKNIFRIKQAEDHIYFTRHTIHGAVDPQQDLSPIDGSLLGNVTV